MAENKKQFEIPLYEKPFLSIEEASVYTGIGRDMSRYRLPTAMSSTKRLCTSMSRRIIPQKKAGLR